MIFRRRNALKLFYCLVFICIGCSVHAKNYYFSSFLGDDDRSSSQAQNKITPWKTLTKLNAVFSILEPGDSVLFRRGETFYGSITVRKFGTVTSPIVISAYGTGPQPVITSLVTLTNWVAAGNGIYESYNDSLAKTINVVLLNNVAQEMGRYPNSNTSNKGYLTLESHVNNSSLTDNELTPSPNWTGAEVVIRKNSWTIDRHLVTTHSGTKISYAPGSNYSYNNPTDNFGYFIQNDIKTLDQFGEWYYNPTTKKMSIFFGEHLPSLYYVQASTIDNLVNSHQQDGYNTNVVFDNLYFKGANANAFRLTWGSNYTIKNCKIEFSGENGIKVNVVSHFKVENCTISNSNNNGIYSGDNNSYAIIKNNKIDSTFIFPGMGKGDDGTGIGIYSFEKSSIIEHNQVFNTGYSGISFSGDSTIIKNNFVNNFCLVKDDGSGIYTWTGSPNNNFHGRKIIGNIIINGIGTKEGTNYNFVQAEGIYLDDNASGIMVSDNTIANISNNGISIHNSRDIILNRNTVFNNSKQFSMNHDFIADPITNIKASDNIFFSKEPSQLISSISSVKNDINNMGKLDSNYYVRPLDDELGINTQYIDNLGSTISTAYNLEGWKSVFNQDQFSKNSPVVIPQYKLNKLVGLNKYPNGDFNTSINGVISYSPANNNSTSQWKNSKLDGGTLQISNSDLTYIIINTGPVDKSKNYILKFSTLGNINASGKVFLRQIDNPYATISTVKNFKIGTTRSENEILFSFPYSDNNSCIVFESNNKNLTYWLDNIQLYEADVTITNPDDYIRFEYNATNINKTVAIDNNYVDAKNVSYSGSVVLKPFSSIILMHNFCPDFIRPLIQLFSK